MVAIISTKKLMNLMDYKCEQMISGKEISIKCLSGCGYLVSTVSLNSQKWLLTPNSHNLVTRKSVCQLEGGINNQGSVFHRANDSIQGINCYPADNCKKKKQQNCGNNASCLSKNNSWLPVAPMLSCCIALLQVHLNTSSSLHFTVSCTPCNSVLSQMRATN